MNTAEVPEGLAPMQYAAKICEDLGIPAKGNVPMIGEAIEAISKSRLFRGRTDAVRVAFIWLSRRVEVAQQQGQKINNLWFLNGQYNDVEKPLPEPKRITYDHYGQGYNHNDMLWLFERYQKVRQSLGNRALTDAEVNVLLNELDKKRGQAPSWRATRG